MEGGYEIFLQKRTGRGNEADGPMEREVRRTDKKMDLKMVVFIK